MPLILAWLLGGLVSIAGSLLGRILIGLGVGYVAYTGITSGLTYLSNLIQSNVNSAGVLVVQALGLVQFDVVVGIIFGAVTAKFVLNGLAGGAVKKMTLK
jgi:hypothetical protein